MKMYKSEDGQTAGLEFDQDEFPILIALVKRMNFASDNDIHRAVAFVDSLRRKAPVLTLVKKH